MSDVRNEERNVDEKAATQRQHRRCAEDRARLCHEAADHPKVGIMELD